MTKIEVYQTNLGLFAHVVTGRSFGANLKVNGIPGDTFKASQISPNSYTRNTWVFMEDIHEITSLEVLTVGKEVLSKYVLKISSIANDEIPSELTPEQVEPYYDDNHEGWRWKNYSDLQSLYKPENIRLPDSWQQEEFEIVVLRKINIDSFESPIQMTVKQDFTSSWTEKPREVDLSSILYYEDIERLLTPEFLLHERPCALSSQQVYGIVRHHIKTHIDAKYARITSDYDFCFTVKKKIAIKPYTNRSEIKNARGRSFARPKFKTNTVEHKEVEVFEMTHAGKMYTGYTPIGNWHASNLKEMKEQIEVYLAALMELINCPVAECPHCNGTGHQVGPKIKTNDRELNDETYETAEA